MYLLMGFMVTFLISRSYIHAQIIGKSLKVQTRWWLGVKTHDVNLTDIDTIGLVSLNPYKLVIRLKNGKKLRMLAGLPDITLVTFTPEFLNFLKRELPEKFRK